MKHLSVLVITRASNYAAPFLRQMQHLATAANAEFVIAGDGSEAIGQLKKWGYGDEEVLVSVNSRNPIDTVLDSAFRCCSGRYVLRLEDDEVVSSEMFSWVINQNYTEADYWKFPRVHLWHRNNLFITNEPLWPDHQTRLNTRRRPRSRTYVPEIRLAPVLIENYGFLVKQKSYREYLAKFKLEHSPLAYYVPEEFYTSMGLKDVSEATLQAVIDAEQWVKSERIPADSVRT